MTPGEIAAMITAAVGAMTLAGIMVSYFNKLDKKVDAIYMSMFPPKGKALIERIEGLEGGMQAIQLTCVANHPHVGDTGRLPVVPFLER